MCSQNQPIRVYQCVNAYACVCLCGSWHTCAAGKVVCRVECVRANVKRCCCCRLFDNVFSKSYESYSWHSPFTLAYNKTYERSSEPISVWRPFIHSFIRPERFSIVFVCVAFDLMRIFLPLFLVHFTNWHRNWRTVFNEWISLEACVLCAAY